MLNILMIYLNILISQKIGENIFILDNISIKKLPKLSYILIKFKIDLL